MTTNVTKPNKGDIYSHIKIEEEFRVVYVGSTFYNEKLWDRPYVLLISLKNRTLRPVWIDSFFKLYKFEKHLTQPKITKGDKTMSLEEQENFDYESGQDRDFYSLMYETKWSHSDKNRFESKEDKDSHEECTENSEWTEDSSKEDNVSSETSSLSPKHYKGVPKQYEHHRVMAVWGMDYHLSAAIKYLARAGKKESAHLSNKQKETEDLNKSITYIKMKLELMEEGIL